MQHFSDETITAINKAIILSIVTELTSLEIRHEGYQQFKVLLKRLEYAGKAIQTYFEKHSNASPELRNTFKKEFLSGKHVLISEILTLLTNMSEDGVESVLNAIREAIEREKPELA